MAAMSVRQVIGICALAGVAILGLLSSVTSLEMTTKVNAFLPADQQFSEMGWYLPKTIRLHREYRRLFPEGKLVMRTRAMGVLMLICLLTAGWSMGLF